MSRHKRKTPEPVPDKPRSGPSRDAVWHWRRDGGLTVLVFAVAFAGFANSLPNGFVYDDVGIIQENPRLDRWWDLNTIFGTSYWADFLPNSRLYRPLAILSFALDRAIFGPGPFGVHLVNVLWNALASVLIYALCFRLLGRRDVSLLAALLFALHPVHTEVVANGVGRCELGAMLAVLGAAHLHLSFCRRRGGGRNASPAGKTRRSRRATGGGGGGYLAGALLLYLAGLLFKETAVVLPAVLLLMDWLLVCEGRLRELRSRAWAYFLFLLPLGLYAAARIAVVGLERPAMQEVMLGAGTVGRMLYASETILRYLGQMTFPLWLCAEYADYTHLIRPHLTDPLVLASLVMWPLGAALVVVLARKRLFVPLFGLAWFFLTLLPASNLIIPVGTIRADRLLYMPSLGFLLMVAVLLVNLRRRAPYPALGLVLVILGFYGWRTVTRNPVWRSHEALWTVTLRDNPGSAVGWYSMGHTHRLRADQARREGNLDRERAELLEAEKAYRRAWELRDGAGYFYLDTHLHHAEVLKRLGDLAGAEAQYRAVLAKNPRERTALMNLGEMLFRQRPHEAIDLFRRAVQEQPDDFRGHANLAQAYKYAGRYEQALQSIGRALELNPGEWRLWKVKADILRRMGRSGAAREADAEAERRRGGG